MGRTHFLFWRTDKKGPFYLIQTYFQLQNFTQTSNNLMGLLC